MFKEKIEILWFKRDLRVKDNPILSRPTLPVLPVFIFDENILNGLPRNDRRVNFIFERVLKLKNELKKRKLDLAVFYGKPEEIFEFLSKKFELLKIYSSSDNDKYSKIRDKKIKERYPLQIIFDSFLIPPDKILTKEGKPYKVYSFFKDKALEFLEKEPLVEFKIPENLKILNFDYENLISIKNGKIEKKPLEIESTGFSKERINFEGALKEPEELLKRFENLIENYEEERNFPFKNSTSLLSVHLRFGTISIRDVLRWALKQNKNRIFIQELIWREFFNYLLYHFPEMEVKGLRKIEIKWKDDEKTFEKWKNGKTGVPLVDAGLRQLEEEGFMHNRVRMVVADFLVKNLKINWKEGEKHFALKLLDYEISSNIGNWQWVSGIGADPKSLWRKFNPYIQSKKYDPECLYIKKYLPELKNLPPSKIHKGELK